MSKLRILFLAACTCLFASCGLSPVAFNDALVDEYQQANLVYDQFTEQLKTLADAGEFEQIATLADETFEKLDASIEKVSNMRPTGKQGAEFRNQVASTLKTLRKGVEFGREFHTFTEVPPRKRDDFKKYQSFNTHQTALRKSTGKLARIQEQFAVDNNLNLR